MFHCTLLARQARPYRSVSVVRRDFTSSSCVRALVMNHPNPVERVTSLTKEQRKEAKELVSEDPVRWTPTNLATHLRVSTNLVQAQVKPPNKRVLKLRRQLAQQNKPRELTPKRALLENWIQGQINKTPEHKERKKEWRKKGNYELKDNIDIPWLDAIETKLAKLQEISLKAINEAKKARREGK